MQPAAEEPAADEGADVVDLDAARLVALVAAAAPLPRAPLLAARVVRARPQLGARDLLVHVAAPAPDLCKVHKKDDEIELATLRCKLEMA